MGYEHIWSARLKQHQKEDSSISVKNLEKFEGAVRVMWRRLFSVSNHGMS